MLRLKDMYFGGIGLKQCKTKAPLKTKPLEIFHVCALLSSNSGSLRMVVFLLVSLSNANQKGLLTYRWSERGHPGALASG